MTKLLIEGVEYVPYDKSCIAELLAIRGSLQSCGIVYVGDRPTTAEAAANAVSELVQMVKDLRKQNDMLGCKISDMKSVLRGVERAIDAVRSIDGVIEVPAKKRLKK